MDKIEIKILNPEGLQDAEDMMVFAARLTQRGHDINSMDDLMQLYRKSHTSETVANMIELPHPTIQKFGLINIAVVGASRRFLAQITRHQNEIKFMSGSLQYSDYSNTARFCVPYKVTEFDAMHPDMNGWARRDYLNSCLQAMDDYRKAVPFIGHDAAAYRLPEGQRNVLIMSVQPYELKHIISQRSCNRNTLETQYVLLKIWHLLEWHPMWRNIKIPCQAGPCPEGRMCCGRPHLAGESAYDILKKEFPLIYNEEDNK